MWLCDSVCKEVPWDLRRVGSVAGVSGWQLGYDGCAGAEAGVRGYVALCTVSVYSAALLNS